MTTAEMTDLRKLPQYQGRPVPWVTKWTGEESLDRWPRSLTTSSD